MCRIGISSQSDFSRLDCLSCYSAGISCCPDVTQKKIIFPGTSTGTTWGLVHLGNFFFFSFFHIGAMKCYALFYAKMHEYALFYALFNSKMHKYALIYALFYAKMQKYALFYALFSAKMHKYALFCALFYAILHKKCIFMRLFMHFFMHFFMQLLVIKKK